LAIGCMVFGFRFLPSIFLSFGRSISFFPGPLRSPSSLAGIPLVISSPPHLVVSTTRPPLPAGDPQLRCSGPSLVTCHPSPAADSATSSSPTLPRSSRRITPVHPTCTLQLQSDPLPPLPSPPVTPDDAGGAKQQQHSCQRVHWAPARDQRVVGLAGATHWAAARCRPMLPKACCIRATTQIAAKRG
jgi:hypothetical protein